MTINYHYDGDSIDVLYETDSAGKVIRQYVYSDNNIRLAMKMNGKTLYYHYNAHGDVVALTDENGKVVAKYAYDAWGVVLKNIATTSEARANPYLYAGYTYDKEIEQYYLMARYYEPEQGVLTAYAPDPGDEDDPQTMNGYNYTNNNPVMMIDPDGNIAWWAVAAAAGSAYEVGKYLYKNRNKGYSANGVFGAVVKGGLNGVWKTGVGRVFGLGGMTRVGMKIIKKKKLYKSVWTNAKSLYRNPGKHLKRTLINKNVTKKSKRNYSRLRSRINNDKLNRFYKKKKFYKGKAVKKRRK